MNGTPPWIPTTHPVKDGEQVRGNVTNRMPNELRQRTDYLKARLDNAQFGSALVLYDVPLDISVRPGQPVYFDVASGAYKQALAKLDYDPVSGSLIPNPSCFVEGVCVVKVTGTRGDVVEMGLVDLDWTQTIGSAGNTLAEGGAYYLSSAMPGKLTKQKPPVSILVALLHGDGIGTANITPIQRDVLEAHVHYAFTLIAEPAGTVSCGTPNQKEEFLTVQPGLPGWLPAAYFGAAAPEGAVFGYNLDQHPALKKVWPPIPVGSVYIELNGIGINPNRFVADMNGLWWMDECWTHAPWSLREGCPDDTEDSSSSSSSGVGCVSDPLLAQLGFPYNDPTKALLRLFFTKMVFKTDNSVVTSLKPRRAGTPVKFFSCDGITPSSTGDLNAEFVVDPLYVDTDETVLAMKSLGQAANSQIIVNRGPVVTRLIAGDFIQLSGQQSPPNSGRFVGPVTITNIPSYLQTRDLAVALVSLDNMRQDDRNGLFWLTFPTGKVSSIRGQIELPLSLVAAGTLLHLEFWMLALDTAYISTPGAVPALKMSHRIMNSPDSGPLLLPTTDSTLVALSTQSVLTNQYFKVVSYDIAGVQNGDKVFFTLQRDELSSYGDIGLTRITARLVAPGS